MRIFNELKGSRYTELTAPYEKYLPEYFGKLGEAYKAYPEAMENEEYNLYVYYNKWPIRKLEYSYVISKMQEAIFEGAKVLDAGCGVSSMPFLWAEFGGDVTAVDFDKKSIDLMKRFDEDAFFGEGRRVNTDVCDIMDLPYEDNTFDVVVSTSVLEHLPYPNYLLAINELYRVLKPNGTLVCTCDLSASEEPKRRAVGAFSVGDIKKILIEFKDELVEEEMPVEQLTISEKEIEQFWLQHHYEGIGYDGNREYVAVGFRIKKIGEGQKKQQLLKYDDLIRELMCYEKVVTDSHKELQKVNEYARGLQEEKERILQDLKAVTVENESRLQSLNKVSEESEGRLRLLNKVSEEKEKYLEMVNKLSEESAERLRLLNKASEESKLYQDMLKKKDEALQVLMEDKQQCETDLKKVTEECAKRLEAIDYLKELLEEKDNIIKDLSKDE